VLICYPDHSLAIPTQVVPRTVLEHAKGFAIFSVVKAGFVFSARAGSGVVIARLDNGSKCAILRHLLYV
jgi:lipid-binding SYLF domain-containing protein